jgi:hypothetical protein
MIERIKDKKIYYPIFIIIMLLLMLIIKFPYTVDAPCQVVGQREWALIQVEPDKMLSKTFDNKEDRTLNYTLLQFAREDFVQFKQFSTNENWINQNDAIANITSLDNQLAINNLSGELDKARDNLAIVSVGEKEALQDEAVHSAELAEIQFAAYEPQYFRNKKLFEANLISSAEWEISRATYDGYKSNIALQQARLEIMQTGEKTEVLRYMNDQIGLINNQVQMMESKIALGNVRAPFDGWISYPVQDSIICLVENVDSLLCKLPIPATDLKYVEVGQKISIRLFETGEEQIANILSIAQRSKLMNGKPGYLVTGYIDEPADVVKPGMSGVAQIQCKSISVLEHLSRSFSKYLMKI